MNPDSKTEMTKKVTIMAEELPRRFVSRPSPSSASATIEDSGANTGKCLRGGSSDGITAAIRQQDVMDHETFLP